MSMNKKLLAAAIAGLLVAGNAGAVVIGTDPARIYAQELVKPVNLSADANDDIQIRIKYNFSNGEVRYGSLQCTNTELTPVGVPTVAGTSNAAGTGSDLVLGAVNGVGTNTLYFSITDQGSAAASTANDTISFEVNTRLMSNAGSDCTFGIYDSPSQAQVGGSTGLIDQSRSNGAYMRTAPSFVFTSTAGARATADVQASPAYTAFTGTDNLFAHLNFALAAVVPLDSDGTPITLADIFAPATSVTMTGSFNAATDVEWDGVGRTSGNTTQSVWSGADLNLAGGGVSGDVAYFENGTTEIAVSRYDAMLDAVTNLGYIASDVSLTDVGQIVRNGTELQAPLVHVPASGHVSRIALTNTGSVARPYTIRIIKETGTTYTVDNANLTGNIPANGTKVIELPTVITGFTAGAPRATVIVTVDAPSVDIQGLYQIVRPDSGAISNHVMVRPDTN